MPIESIQQILHLRTKRNKQVMQNIERLWEIDANATSAQDFLDALHPWGPNQELKFHNLVPLLICAIGIATFLGGIILSGYIPFLLSLLGCLICFALVYVLYEPNHPIDDLITHLEFRTKLLKYDLHYDEIPRVIKAPMSNHFMLNRLKQYFPIFNQGAEYNDIEDYAATTWKTSTGIEFPVLLFRYHYVTELTLPTLNGTSQNIKQVHKDAWGAFVFNISPLGFAASNRRKEFFEPYREEWVSSDIQFNRQIKIFGSKKEILAKRISPAFTLKISDLFEQTNGDLISHHQEHILCFIGDRNLFKVRARKPKKGINTISELRGYLRTMEMQDYEKFKKVMLELIT